MKAKTLLVAAAALAAATISSQAQVYSQNIVGYVNVVCPAGANVFLATPLTTGNDVLTNVLVGVPGGTTIQLWNTGGNSFTGLSYSGPANNRHWKDGASVIQDNTLIPPGKGYFINAGATFTNTFVGSVVAATGTSVTNNQNNNLQVAGAYYATGTLIPFSGSVSNTATMNFVPPGGTTIQVWDAGSQTFTPYSYSGPANNRTWKDQANNVVAPPTINVGQGLFMIPGQPYNWVQTAP